MSNYLFVAGKNDSVDLINAYFQDKHKADEDELSHHNISQEVSILVIERRYPNIDSSIFVNDNGDEGTYFRGQALDHETSSMILGAKGFCDFQQKFSEFSSPDKIADFEGSFILARWDMEQFTLQTDLYSMYRLIFYSNDEVVIASDSLVVITECMKALGVKREINRDVALIKAWNASGLPNCPFTPELIVKGVFTVQVGSFIHGKWTQKGISCNLIQRDVKQLFESSNQSYVEILSDCVKRMYSTIKFATEAFSPVIEFGLSGGIDSRVLLALCLQSESIMDTLVINTNTSPTRVNDFEVVTALSHKFNFEFNNRDIRTQKLAQFASNRILINNRLGFWKLASLGTYDSFYLTPHFYSHPCIMHMSGVGAEPVKQAMDTSRIDNLARSQHPLVREKVRGKISETVQGMGISPQSNQAMKFFHMSYKASYHLGFKIAQSSMLLRPYVQKSIFSMALADDNPFRGKPNQGPTALHDMIILLNPELASLPYDSDKKNITPEYVAERLDELGGAIKLSKMPQPSIFGKIEHIANGPPNAFLKMVEEFKWHDEIPQRVQLANMVKHNFESKFPDDLKEIYLSCYEKTLQNLENSKVELAAAGAMAARFIVFDLFDE